MNETAIDADREICDPHHHLWDRLETSPSYLTVRHYLLPEFLADIGQGHRVTSTVLVEAGAFYRADGPALMAPLGETEFFNGIAAMAASGRYGAARVGAGIVAYVDLRAGAAVERALEAHLQTAGQRLKGIRNTAPFDPTGSTEALAPGRAAQLYLEPEFRVGFARLRHFGLSFDAWLYHPQIPELTDLARHFPDQNIVLDHAGTPLGIGHYAGRRDEVFSAWRSAMTDLAACPNVCVKLGGLGMYMLGNDIPEGAEVTSVVLARTWRPYIETCIELFGADRCMFESNFPVDARNCDYGVLWNAFKRITASYTESEKAQFFHDTAVRVYGLA